MSPITAFLHATGETPLREPLEEKEFLVLMLVCTVLCWALARWRYGLSLVAWLVGVSVGCKVLATVSSAWSDGVPWLHSDFDPLYAGLATTSVLLPILATILGSRQRAKRKKPNFEDSDSPKRKSGARLNKPVE